MAQVALLELERQVAEKEKALEESKAQTAAVRRGNDFVESESIKAEKEIEKEKQTLGRIKEEQSQLKKDIDSIKEYQISQQALLDSLNDVLQHLTDTKNNLKENVKREAIEQNKRRDEIEFRLKNLAGTIEREDKVRVKINQQKQRLEEELKDGKWRLATESQTRSAFESKIGRTIETLKHEATLKKKEQQDKEKDTKRDLKAIST